MAHSSQDWPGRFLRRRKDQLDPLSGCPNNRGCLKKSHYQWGFNGMCLEIYQPRIVASGCVRKCGMKPQISPCWVDLV
jgi:hypothetical protein